MLSASFFAYSVSIHTDEYAELQNVIVANPEGH
jgi:hypothetical protein